MHVGIYHRGLAGTARDSAHLPADRNHIHWLTCSEAKKPLVRAGIEEC